MKNKIFLIVTGIMVFSLCLIIYAQANLGEQNPTPPRKKGEPIIKSIASLTQLHNASSPQYDKDCLKSGCHKGILERTTLDESVPEAHRLVNMMGLPANHCILCHESVEIVSGKEKERGNAGSLGKNVNAVLKCYPCHSKNGPGKRLYGPPKKG